MGQEEDRLGLRLEFDYLSGRTYISNKGGMRIAVTSSKKAGEKELQILLERVQTILEVYYEMSEDKGV